MGVTPAEGGCRVAVVGAGRMAREHIRAFAAVPGVAVEGIHSRTRTRAEALASELGVPRVCDSVGALYEETRAHLVVVTVFELAMKDVALACLEFPWTVLLEKPPGLTVAEGEAIAERAEKAGAVVRVALNRQYLSSTQAVLGELAAEVGPRFVRVQDQQSLAQARALGHPEAVVRNWMYANSIHLVDYFRLFARGAVEAVESVLPWDAADPQVVVSRLRFASGDVGLYEAIWHAPGPWAASVSVRGRRFELRPLEKAVAQRTGEAAVSLPVHAWDESFKPGFRLQAERAVAAARGRSSDLPKMTEALTTMRLVSRIYRESA